MVSRPYQICSRCIMDTSDPFIRFDSRGHCNHCTRAEIDARNFPMTPETKKLALDRIVLEIQTAGHGKRYDCIIGLSGGVDSTYTAYQVKQLGLRPLAVHFDNAWDSELAVKNIENIVKRLEIDLDTFVMDWDEFRDLQLAFLKASTPDSEIPTDHAIVAVLLQAAVRHGIRHVISGNNHSTESILPESFSYGSFDWRYIRDVHRRFGSVPLKHFPHFSFLGRLYYIFIKQIKNVMLLNYLPYRKSEAIEVISQKLGWINYGGKHHESTYTKFFQAYLLPRKFNIDKRRAHLSSLIVTGQMRRETALEEVKKDPYPAEQISTDLDFVKKKFGLSDAQFEAILNATPKTFRDFRSDKAMLERVAFLIRFLKKYGLLPKRVGI